MTDREYTPSTEQVAHAYADGLAGTSRTRAESLAEAHRALAAERKAGAVEALRDLAETRFFNGDTDRAIPGYNELHDRADEIEATR